MKKNILLVILVVLTIGCASCSSNALAAPGLRATAVLTASAKTVKTEATPTLNPTPTYNGALETMVAALASTSEADRATTISARETTNAVQAVPIQATSDAEARKLAYVQITASVEAATWAAYPTSIPLTVAAQSTQNSARNIQATVAAMNATGSVIAPTQIIYAAKASSEAQNMNLIVVMNALTPLFVFGAFLLAVIPLVYVLRRPHVFVPSNSSADPIAATTPTQKIKLETTDAYGWGSLRFKELPIPWDVLLDVARLITEGRRYTQAQMTGSGNPLVKDGSYDAFGAWMVDNHISGRAEDGRYHIVHLEFFEQVLTHRPA